MPPPPPTFPLAKSFDMAGPKGSINSCSFLALAWSWHFPWTCSQWLKLRPFGVHTAGHPLPSGGSAILWLGACALEPTQTWVQILTLSLVSSGTLLCLSFLTCEMKEIMPTVLGGPRLKDNLFRALGTEPDHVGNGQ